MFLIKLLVLVLKQIIFFLALAVSPIIEADGLTYKDLSVDVPDFDARIPLPKDVVGLAVGERHWYHHEIVRYLDALAESSPRMLALGEYARSHGGRSLVSYAITSETNLARLDAIEATRAKIIDPDANLEIDDLPAVIHLMYGIHGNEPSASNVTPLIAHFLTATKDPDIMEQLEDVVIILNPVLNPDGHDRFANWTNSRAGLNPSPDPNDSEHRESNPTGRTNYYWFDLNRDWLPHQQPESVGRLKVFHRWKPNVQLDFHEMGRNSTYFFMPGVPERTNPLTPKINQTLTAKISEYHARAFDRDGISYFTEETFDDFYVGKGSTYPDLFGCVGILFEQASARGVHQETVNGLLTFETALTNQFRASLSSLKATAAMRAELLKYQRDFYTKDRNRGHYLATADDATRLHQFVRLLLGHDIEIEVLTKDVQVKDQLFPANKSIAIPLDQPQSTYLMALWERRVEFRADIFYDVSAWTMPLAFNLQHTTKAVRSAKTKALPQGFFQTSTVLVDSNIGYLIDWRDSATPALLYDLLEAKAHVKVAKRTFTARVNQGEVNFGYGTLFVSAALGEAIPASAISLLEQAARDGLPVYSVVSSLTPSGIDLGSRDFVAISKPRVLMLTGGGTSQYETGELWHLFDTRVDMPITMVDVARLNSVELSDYTHVVLTDQIIGESETEQIRQFIERGGILWAQGANTLESLNKAGLADVFWRQTAEEIRAEALKAAKKDENSTKEIAALIPDRKAFADADENAALKLVRGAILEGKVDITHPLGYGYSSDFLPTFRRSAKFMEKAQNSYSTPVIYTESPLLSGYMSDENQRLASKSASLIVNVRADGAIVMALDRVAFRAFWWGTQRLLLNAIFFGALIEEPN